MLNLLHTPPTVAAHEEIVKTAPVLSNLPGWLHHPGFAAPRKFDRTTILAKLHPQAGWRDRGRRKPAKTVPIVPELKMELPA